MGKNRKPEVGHIGQVVKMYHSEMLALFIPISAVTGKQLRALEGLIDGLDGFLYSLSIKLGEEGGGLPKALAASRLCRGLYVEAKEKAEEREAVLAKDKEVMVNA